MSRTAQAEHLALLEVQAFRKARRKIDTYYPDTGPLRRELYKKHTGFFEAGATFRERAAMAANRIGKTEGIGGYELSLHLTGQYPDWWKGRRFTKAVRAWAAGSTNQTVRDILQDKLIGPVGSFGTGMIPGAEIVDMKRRAGGVADSYEQVYVRHVSGGTSRLVLKSYEQGRKSFEGVEQDVILLDEEPDDDIYGECTIRTMTTKGLIMLTFTPLEGLSSVVLRFMPGGKIPNDMGVRYIMQATWDDAPHLTKEEKEYQMASMLPHQIDARAKGIPALGAGAIYPIAESDLLCSPFTIPEHFPQVYGMDVGWKWTAALWGAYDREHDIVYLHSEYKRGHAEPPVHTDAIKARGIWIPGTIDPNANGRGQRDGSKLLTEYLDLGLDLVKAVNAVEAGTLKVWKRMTTGGLKVFNTLVGWTEEFRIYRRNDHGKVVKMNDHYMDCMRYMIMSGLSIAKTKPIEGADPYRPRAEAGEASWMGR